jgi:hypothetical protein
MKDFFSSKLSTKSVDKSIDQKIEKICIQTGRSDKLDSLVKKKHSISQLRFVRAKFFLADCLMSLGWLVTSPSCNIQSACRSCDLSCEKCFGSC